MPKSYLEYKTELIMEEWKQAQVHIARFDTIGFSIRGWAVSIVSAVLVIAANQKHPALMLFGPFPVAMFWLLDGLHKAFQRQFIERSRELEKYISTELDAEFKSGALAFVAPDFGVRFIRRKSWIGNAVYVVKCSFLYNVALPYLFLLVTCLAAYEVLSRVN
jgi:hypothetical protein